MPSRYDTHGSCQIYLPNVHANRNTESNMHCPLKNEVVVTFRHNEVRDITGKLLEEVCKDARKEPVLMELNDEQLRQTTANRRPEARLDISATGFWMSKSIFRRKGFFP